MKQNKKAKIYAVFCFAGKRKLLVYIYAVIVKQIFYKRFTNHYLDGFCNQNADQLGYLAGPSRLPVYVGVVEYASASPYTYSTPKS